jgi:hypothetical protein
MEWASKGRDPDNQVRAQVQSSNGAGSSKGKVDSHYVIPVRAMANMASTMTMTLECTRIRAEVSPVALVITALSKRLQLSLRQRVGQGVSKAAKGGMGGMGKECDA